jgi:antitoxin component of MazEF toxin-antitoxin module
MKLKLGVRKIQKVRGSAFVNLPQTWIKTYNLRKGDKVNIDLREDGTLEISPIDATEVGDGQ